MIVYVPIINHNYSVFIPIGKTVGEIKHLLIETVESFYGEKFLNNAKLYDKDNSIVFEDNVLVKNTNIKNGTKILLI